MNSQITKRRNPFEKPLQTQQEEQPKQQIEPEIVELVEEKEEVVYETPVFEQKPVNQPVQQQYIQPQQPQQPQYYEQKPVARAKNTQPRVVNRDTRQYYANNNEVTRDKFTSTMETTLRRNIKIVCAQRGIMFAQFVEDACKEKLQREGFR